MLLLLHLSNSLGKITEDLFSVSDILSSHALLAELTAALS